MALKKPSKNVPEIQLTANNPNVLGIRPAKFGDIIVDTANNKVYIAKDAYTASTNWWGTSA